jgi:hypothetical protein
MPPDLGYVRGICSSGKKSFFNRNGAKALVRALKAEGDKAVRAYRCDECDHWHAGHLPTAIRRGIQTEAEWRAAR